MLLLASMKNKALYFVWEWLIFHCEQAEKQVEEYQGMRAFILGWTEKAEALVSGNIIWTSASQLQEQIRAHQVNLYSESHSRDRNSFNILENCCCLLQKTGFAMFWKKILFHALTYWGHATNLQQMHFCLFCSNSSNISYCTVCWLALIRIIARKRLFSLTCNLCSYGDRRCCGSVGVSMVTWRPWGRGRGTWGRCCRHRGGASRWSTSVDIQRSCSKVPRLASRVCRMPLR